MKAISNKLNYTFANKMLDIMDSNRISDYHTRINRCPPWLSLISMGLDHKILAILPLKDKLYA